MGCAAYLSCVGRLSSVPTVRLQPGYVLGPTTNTTSANFGRIMSQTKWEACGVILTLPGEEAQVDYGSGPMVRDPQNGKYRRTRLFVMMLGYSRKAVRILTFRSSSRILAELHGKAFGRLGGSTGIVVLDNLKEGVLLPDIYDPSLNPL